MIEVMPACDYYGLHATGTVLLVDHFPRHFTDPGHRHDALETKRFIEAREQQLQEHSCDCENRAQRVTPA